jgi:hypothetical protein
MAPRLIQHIEQETLVSLLPSYNPHYTLLSGNKLPCHNAKIESTPIKYFLSKINRQVWVEGLYVQKKDLNKVIRYKNSDGSFKNDFDEKQFLEWVNIIENNTVLCEMENEAVGKGVFVPPGKTLPRGNFIPSSGIIKFNPTISELETKVHCSALQNLNSHEKKIVGIIDPEKMGGILNFINHAPDKEEIANFVFKESSVKNKVSTANLKSVIKFYKGYAIMGLEVCEDILGGKFGKQLLWSYARSCEYHTNDYSEPNNKKILLFDNRDSNNGEIIDTKKYGLKTIDIFIDTGGLILHKAASLTRWEIMDGFPEAGIAIATDDPYAITQTKLIPSLIPYKFLQAQLVLNPNANRIIMHIPILKEISRISAKR